MVFQSTTASPAFQRQHAASFSMKKRLFDALSFTSAATKKKVSRACEASSVEGAEALIFTTCRCGALFKRLMSQNEANALL